jgi:hypothetical protein
MAELCFQFSTSTAWTSGLIRRLTHSDFSHVDIIEPGVGLWGVSGLDDSIKDPGGVRCRKFDAWPYLYPPKVARLQTTDEVVRKTLEWARAQEGAEFDNAALYHFLRDRAGLRKLGREWRDPHKWFCSEYALRAPELGGAFSYPLITPKDVVSPNDDLIHFNPLMLPDNILQFTD